MAEFVIRKKHERNAYFGGGTATVSREDATSYETMAQSEEALASVANILGVEQAELEALRKPTSGEHREGQPSYERWRSGSREPTGGEHKEDDALDDYIRRAQAFITSGQIDDDEIDYKAEISTQLRQAQEAVVAGNSQWPSDVRNGLVNNLIGGSWRARDVVTDWFASDTDPARSALQALWDDSAPVGYRIRTFLEQIPSHQNFQGSGTRLRVVAVLLMALGAGRYPPFKIREFNAGFDATGYGRPPSDADEGALYEYSLAFLDTLVERTRELGYARPADRLEAQSVVWMMSREPAPPSRTPALWQVRAGTDAEYAPRFLELGRVDIGFEWHRDLREVDSRDELTAHYRGAFPESSGNAPTQMWQFAHEMELGDVVLIPLPGKQVHVGEITGPYRFEENPSSHSHAMDVHWLARNVPHARIGEAVTDAFVRWTVQKLDDPDVIKGVQDYLNKPELDSDPEPPLPDLDALARELLLEPAFLRKVERLLEEKRQVIFQGPPGTGKTFVARKLALALAGAEARTELVQFHPSYAYEDFVQGFRPTLKAGAAGFELRDGPLVQMAKRAQADLDKGLSTKHFLVIDEINRGNIAKVFGELYFLLEYRDQGMQLQYAGESDERFSLPSNLYIIGTMNTADRSIALVDLALRRRFSFVKFHPDEEPIDGLLKRWLDRNAADMGWVADVVDRANEKLDELGNREAAIGPSYFMKDGLDEERVERIWEHDVLPYVEEQLYGQPERLKEFDLKTLRSADEGTDGEPEGGDSAEQGDAPGSGDGDA